MGFRILPILLLCVCLGSSAEIIGGFDFPSGPISFADEIVSYEPGFGSGPEPDAVYQDPSNAIGLPDDTSGSLCTGAPADCPYVSLGNGGRLIVRFTDNVLSGGGDNGFDLIIFEVGAQVEATFVDLSTNGTDWVPVGKIEGSSIGIDLDAIGIGLGDDFTYVRLTDDTDPAEGAIAGATVGADIDAIGAISPPPPGPGGGPGTNNGGPAAVPIPAAYAVILSLTLLVIGAVASRRRTSTHSKKVTDKGS